MDCPILFRSFEGSISCKTQYFGPLAVKIDKGLDFNFSSIPSKRGRHISMSPKFKYKKEDLEDDDFDPSYEPSGYDLGYPPKAWLPDGCSKISRL